VRDSEALSVSPHCGCACIPAVRGASRPLAGVSGTDSERGVPARRERVVWTGHHACSVLGTRSTMCEDQSPDG
jgi:hypothetical protein